VEVLHYPFKSGKRNTAKIGNPARGFTKDDVKYSKIKNLSRGVFFPQFTLITTISFLLSRSTIFVSTCLPIEEKESCW
jgi:hypothetical protein